MSIDLKIERFGAELANRLFVNHQEFVPNSLDDYSGVESELNDDIEKAVLVHTTFFISYYYRVYQDYYDQFRMNQMDFLVIAMDVFPHQLLGEDVEEVMSKFVSSCAFLMSICVMEMGKRDFRGKIHLIWAMFVDLELKDEFYKAGGWAELRKYAWIYCEPAYWFMQLFTEGNVLSHRVDLTMQSLLALGQLRHVVESDLPMGLQWVDFVTKNPSRSASLMLEEIEDLEVSLELLKNLLDPFAFRETVYGEFILAAEMAGMKERAWRDALARGGDLWMYPEFKVVMEKHAQTLLRVHRLSDQREDSLVESMEGSSVDSMEGSSVGSMEDSSVESMDETEDGSGDCVMNSSEIHGDDWDISSKPASKSLPGRVYLTKYCNEYAGHSPLSLLNENERSTLLKSPIKENKEIILQEEPVPEITGSQVEESSCNSYIYHELMETLQRNYPHLIKPVSGPSESEGVSITMSKVFSVLTNSYEKRLRIVVSDGGESEPKSDCSSGLSNLPKKKRGKPDETLENT